jgi:putative spermidine/putrescine transport system permease protein
MQLGRWLYLGLIPAILLLAGFFYALFTLVASAFVSDGAVGFARFAAFFARADYIDVLVRTLWIAGLTTAIAVVIGYPVAYLIARTRTGRTWLLLLVIAPWLTSVVVRTYGWMVILGNRGLINGFLQWAGLGGRPVPLMYNAFGIIVGLVHVLCPFMIIAIFSTLQQLDPALEEAAMSLRARPWRIFRKVMLPLTLPGVISGAIVVYLMATGAIVTPLLLGGLRDRMLGTQIFQEIFALYNFRRAAAMALILLVSSLIVIIPMQLAEARVRRWTQG